MTYSVNLEGKLAIVTGAAQGLGLAIARGYLEAGASVVMADVRPDIGEVAAGLGAGERAVGRVLDVRDEAAIEACVEDAVGRYGPLYIMVNNAAVTVPSSIWDISAQEWDDVLAINLRSVFFGCRSAGRRMKPQRAGRIINLSSMAGQRGGIFAGAHYSAAKAGVLAVTKAFAQELADSGITVNAIAPAAIDGPITRAMPPEKSRALARGIPLGRLGDDREVAAAALYLASDGAGFVTGATLDINGGLLMR